MAWTLAWVGSLAHDEFRLNELQVWYGAQCNGSWEHTYGIKIETLDNPGWMQRPAR
jgi:hypothetical protein